MNTVARACMAWAGRAWRRWRREVMHPVRHRREFGHRAGGDDNDRVGAFETG
jgi:hypothetical protein